MKSRIYLACFVLMIAGCGGGGSSGTTSTESTVIVSWTENRESGVNNTGGGYRVYYSNTSEFNIGTADVVDVPYVSGAKAPTSTTLTLSSGTHYIKVVAYTALNPTGSATSNQTAITAP